MSTNPLNAINPNLTRWELTIKAGESLSDSVDLRGFNLVGLIFPEVIGGVLVTVYWATDPLKENYVEAVDTNGSTVDFAVTAGKGVLFVPSDLASVRFLKLKTDVVQTVDTVIVLSVRPLTGHAS